MLRPLGHTGAWQHLKAATLQHAAELLHPTSATHPDSWHPANSGIQPRAVSANKRQQDHHVAQQAYQHSTQQMGLHLESVLLQHLLLWPAQQLHHQQHPHQLCQLRHYHPATHAARTLTQKLMQQHTWQELRLLFDASGGGGRLNPIQLCALLQHLARLAPAPELLSATERGELRGFANELVATCMTKVHRLDAVGLSNMISSALKLGCTAPLQQQQQQYQQDSSGSEGYRYVELLLAAAKQVTHANAHAAGMLLAALTNLQQQQQQQQQPQQQQLGALQQQLDLWASFAAALSRRLQACAAAQHLSCQDASKLCSTVSRLSGLLARQRTAAALAAAATTGTFQQQQQTSAHAAVNVWQDFDSDLADVSSFDREQLPAELPPVTGDTAVEPLARVVCQGHPQDGRVTTTEQLQQLQQHYTQLQQQLRALLSLAAQQVEQQASFAPAAAGGSLVDVSRVLYALAKSWAGLGWPAVLGLLRQYSTNVQSAQEIATSAAAAAEAQQGRGGNRGSKSRRQQQQQQTSRFNSRMLSQPGLGFTDRTAGRVYGDPVAEDETAELLTAVRESLPPVIWAAGRLAEQQLQQLHRQRVQHQQLLQELQQHQQLWGTVGPVLTVIQQHLGWLGPLQLVQVAAGLGKLVHSSRSLVQLAEGSNAQAHAPGMSSPGARADANSSSAAATGQVDGTAAPAGQSIVTAAAAAATGSAVGEVDKAAAVVTKLLAGPELRRLLQQHVGRVESLLPLLALQHRVQLAAAYGQLGLQLPRSVAAVFDRDQPQAPRL